ncbi:MAG: tyrosine-type recombinase/integrase [Bacteroides sp.]|nr:tyrosine-type recombinase/integrase [Bacteroides sp.]MCM1549976.1 tyrosine-type recombinase/integrase [Clostridium sp.]
MYNLTETLNDYFYFCQYQKRLDDKTLKAYRIDLAQFSRFLADCPIESITPDRLEAYISHLHQTYKPKTVKRKIASLKAFFHYLEYKDIIRINPFHKLQVKFREPVILPKTIPLHTIEALLASMYQSYENTQQPCRKKRLLRDIAVIELLFSTGMRISELCSLHPEDVNLVEGIILIHGKGAKERRIQIGNENVLNIIRKYQGSYAPEIAACRFFFVNQNQQRLSEQSVRRLINKHGRAADIELHITPHMFRHSFATYLLEADVDIRYIQEMLGHSSINITEIYTHVAMAKQRDILMTKHPRKDFRV